MDRVLDVPILSPIKDLGRHTMQTPLEVERIIELHKLGWGIKRIARELGIARNTVRRYVRAGGWTPYQRPRRAKALDGVMPWLEEEFRRHRGNCVVVQQELKRVHNIDVALRTVERAVQPFRRELAVQALATVRFETPPGRQLQADFGQKTVVIAGEPTKVHLGVMTLGYSRRIFVAAFPHERQECWLSAIEGAFRRFNGVPEEVLVDNARALVKRHNMATRQVVFAERFEAFAKYWNFRPVACAPYRARTKGKDERSVGYVKANALAGRSFTSWEALHGHLEWWMRDVADIRVHGTTGQIPLSIFDAHELSALRPLDGRPPFVQIREFERVVHNDICVLVDTNKYSVPWKFIGLTVTVNVVDGEVVISRAGQELARHSECRRRNQFIVDPAHFDGLVREDREPETSSLVRPLDLYAQVAGGVW